MGFGSRSRPAPKKGPRWNNGLTRRLRPSMMRRAQPAAAGNGEMDASGPVADEDINNENDEDVEYEDDGDGDDLLERRFEDIEAQSLHDSQMGFLPYESGPGRPGWLVNVQGTLVKDAEWPGGRSAVEFYFLEEDGGCFRCSVRHSPYFFVKCKMGTESEVEDALRKRIGNSIECIARVEKEDLDMPNHVSGLKRPYLQLSFRNVSDMLAVRKTIQQQAFGKGAAKQSPLVDDVAVDIQEYLDDYNEIIEGVQEVPRAARDKEAAGSAMGCILDLREHDIPYHLRVCIDLRVRVGLWYTVTPGQDMVRIPGRDVRPDPVVLAFDIETSKAPLKFPDASVDAIMMISYMIDGQGFLIVNRGIVSRDIGDFEYTPRPEYPGLFAVFNEADEAALLRRFFSHVLLARPAIFVTYNGDSFDWPFIDARAARHGMRMSEIIGFGPNSQGEYHATYASHMDCYRWVKRDSYLPAGSQGLKSVTTCKLGYDPLELDPEEMTPLAREDPQTLASYSVSDAVATYYLYMKYVHPFIFSLCTVIPLPPDEVLRKGSGTLCETLLMAEAHAANVVMPNKHLDAREQFHRGHLLHSQTYIGGHVECLESGVFRSDFDYKFACKPEALQQLIADLDRALRFCLKTEADVEDVSTVTNYAEIRADIEARLRGLLEAPNRMDRPLIYHLDVAAMYPNIILTNRLQPSAMVTEAACAVCDFNRPGRMCARTMQWSWRGEFFTAQMNEYKQILTQLESERFPLEGASEPAPFHALPAVQQQALIHRRLTKYSQKVYKRVRNTEVVKKDAIVCQRENSFYIDTVRNFRDRRYEYKDKLKAAKKYLEEAQRAANAGRIEEGGKLTVLYDSLQLAHKCILNSFYGYVMRRGARWYSMEMAGIVCETGAAIIRLARQLVEQLGRPLELDTDGIWCMLPGPFPQNYTFAVQQGDRTRKVFFAYPAIMLNHLVHDRFSNHQYHTLVGGSSPPQHRISSENSIFFEIDGPYKAMIVPSSTEENKLLKKRYAVFAEDGKLAELKGFEVKRRGELKIVKVFQTQLFRAYLGGDCLAGCYGEVAKIANYWLDVLQSRGEAMSDAELFDLISENRSMSRSLAEYGDQKSTSISTARRLAEFLGAEMVKDRGLACKFVISARPFGDPVASRAVPVAIFSAEPAVKRQYLRKWLRDSSLDEHTTPRSIIDWQYYEERVHSMILKLISIPAALQGVDNPVSRVLLPPWLSRRVASIKSTLRQQTISFAALEGENVPPSERVDIEDAFGRKRRAAGQGAGPPPAADAVVEIDEDYSVWIQHHRTTWRQMRAQLRGVSADSSVSSVWQIVHAEQSRLHPGQFAVWYVSSAGNMLRTTLEMSRRFYVHALKPLPPDDMLLPLDDTWKLPLPYAVRGEPPSNRVHHLYAVETTEGQFRECQDDLAAAFAHPNVEGVYEDAVPLEFALTCQLGCIVDAPPKCRSVDSLRMLTTQPYLESHPIAALYVWHQQHVVVAQLHTESMQFPKKVVLADATALTLPNLRKLCGEEDFEPVSHVAQLSDVSQVLAEYLQRCSRRAGQRHPTLAVVNSSELDLGALPMPTCRVPAATHVHGDSKAVLRAAVSAASGFALPTVLAVARYAQVPIGALLACYSSLEDLLSFVGDVFLARTLRSRGYLLPATALRASPRLCVDGDFPMDRAGAFTTVCLEVDVRGLALNAMVEYARLQLHSQTAVDASVLSALTKPVYECTDAVFEACRTLVRSWMGEPHRSAACIDGTPLVTLFLGHFFRWIRPHSPHQGRFFAASDLYATALRPAMHRLRQMLADKMQARGALIVYLDNHRMVFRTPKPDAHSAQAFWSFVQRALLRDDGGLLRWVSFTVLRVWKRLIWLDAGNFGGLDATRPPEQLALQLCLARHLPPGSLPTALRATLSRYLSIFCAADIRDERTGADRTAAGDGEDRAESPFLPFAFTQRVLAQLKDLHVKHRPVPCPPVLGSTLHIAPSDAVMEWCKFATAVMSLYRPTRGAVHALRRHCFALMGRSEWSDGSQFMHPTREAARLLRLTDVLCPQCPAAFDLDLTVGPSSAGSETSLFCPECAQQLDMAPIESDLLSLGHAALSAHQQADLACTRCHRVTERSMPGRCFCTGEFGLVSGTKGALLLEALTRVAETFNMASLRHFCRSYQ